MILHQMHPNISVTATIPSDFRDDELIDELDSNLWDLYHFVGDDKEDFFVSVIIKRNIRIVLYNREEIYVMPLVVFTKTVTENALSKHHKD